MANFEFVEALGQIARDQNIDEGELLLALANALLVAFKRRPDAPEDAEVEINPETGEITVWGLELDIEGNVVREWDATPDDFGRIVFEMIDRGEMRKSETDQLSDFHDVYTIDESFAHDYKIDVMKAFRS